MIILSWLLPANLDLRVNTSLDEIVRYSPRMIDVINLEKGIFETIEIDKLLKEYGSEYPKYQRASINYQRGSSPHSNRTWT